MSSHMSTHAFARFLGTGISGALHTASILKVLIQYALKYSISVLSFRDVENQYSDFLRFLIT